MAEPSSSLLPKIWRQEILGRWPTRDPREERLLAFCDHLRNTMVYEEKEGYYYWPGIPEEECRCGRCTNGARVIARQFGGRVYGYRVEPGQHIIGEDCFGHDFAVVDNYLVDWWAWDYDRSLKSPVLHLRRDERIIRRLYKPIEQWEELEIPKHE